MRIDLEAKCRSIELLLRISKRPYPLMKDSAGNRPSP
jgi:hypothetical protein